MPPDEQPNSIDPFASEKYESPTLNVWAKQAAGKDVDTLKGIYGGATGMLPRLFDAVQQSNTQTFGPGPQTRTTDELPFELRDPLPGASAETAMNLVGLGAGGAVKGAAGALGGKLAWSKHDPIDIWAADTSKLEPGQMVTAGPGGPTGTFQGISPGGSTLVNWNAGKTATFKPTKNEDWLAEGLDNIFGKSKPTAAAEQPLKVSDLKPVGGQLGSNAGGIFADSTGGKYYIKQPATPDHVANELAASRLYQLAGSNTLKYRPVEGGGHVATKWENLEKNNVSQLTPTERKQATEDFATHAWLSNWDAVGLGGDNVGILNGKPVVLDVGGSLKYRAKGEPKGDLFGTQVTEIDSLRNPNLNPDSSGLFGKMTDEEIKQSAKRVVDIPDDAIRKAAGNDELANKLIARKQYLADRFGLQPGGKKPSFAYSVGEAKGKFQQAEEDSWAMLKKGFEQAKGVKSPPSLLDQMPGLKAKMVDPVEEARIKGGYVEPAYRGLQIHPVTQLSSVHGNAAMYSTADPVLADMYSAYLSDHGGPNWHPPEGTFGEGSGVVPLWIDTSKYLHTDAKGADWTNFNSYAIQEAKKAGKHGVVIDNVWDEPNSTKKLSGPKKIFITFPEGAPTVKSKFASKFDPTSPDMMQGIGAIGIGGPAGYVSMAEPSGKMDQKPQQGQLQPQGQGAGQGVPQMSPGVAKFLMEFLKSNPDLAKEMSTRMQAVINGKQIQQQQAPAGPQQPPQMPPQQGM